jgi:hypothetical protein
MRIIPSSQNYFHTSINGYDLSLLRVEWSGGTKTDLMIRSMSSCVLNRYKELATDGNEVPQIKNRRIGLDHMQEHVNLKQKQ